MHTLKDGPQLCFPSQMLLTGVSLLLSFLQHKRVCQAAVAGLRCKNAFGEGSQPGVGPGGTGGCCQPKVPSHRVEKAPPLGGSLQKGPPLGRAVSKGLASLQLVCPKRGS